MSKRIVLEFEVGDDFEAGVCYDCPLSEIDTDNELKWQANEIKRLEKSMHTIYSGNT